MVGRCTAFRDRSGAPRWSGADAGPPWRAHARQARTGRGSRRPIPRPSGSRRREPRRDRGARLAAVQPGDLHPGNTRGGWSSSTSPRASLNEGRGLDPGNTAIAAFTLNSSSAAQRRPGPRPRQHGKGGRCSISCIQSLNEGRGLDPGNTSSRTTGSVSRSPLNEGRGLDPGNTAGWRGRPNTSATALNEGRGLDPGNTSPSPSPRPRPRPLNEGRGLDPGNTPRGGEPPPSTAPLNEGRGLDPGNTAGLGGCAPAEIARSTKAGASTPATHVNDVLNELRVKIAQRRPGPRPRQHAVSFSSFATRASNAQRRPGPRPRQHCR